MLLWQYSDERESDDDDSRTVDGAIVVVVCTVVGGYCQGLRLLLRCELLKLCVWLCNGPYGYQAGVWSEAMVAGRGKRAHGTALRQRRCMLNRCNTRERGTRAVGEAADVMANPERQLESGAIIVQLERGLSCGMYDTKHEHGVTVHTPGGASGRLRC